MNEDRSGDTPVWLAIFEGDWLVVPPDPAHTITPGPAFHGCTYVLLQASDSGRTEIGGIPCGDETQAPAATNTSLPSSSISDFPLLVGTTWVYRYLEYEPTATDPVQTITATAYLTETVIENKQVDSFLLAQVRRDTHYVDVPAGWSKSTGDQSETFWYVFDGQRVYNAPDPFESTQVSTDTLNLEYDLPLAVGKTWCPIQVDLKDPSHPKITSCTASGKETVQAKDSYTAPFGKFDSCYWITQDFNSGGVNQWFCNGIGQVYARYDHAGTRFGFRQELVRYLPGSGEEHVPTEDVKISGD